MHWFGDWFHEFVNQLLTACVTNLSFVLVAVLFHNIPLCRQADWCGEFMGSF